MELSPDLNPVKEAYILMNESLGVLAAKHAMHTAYGKDAKTGAKDATEATEIHTAIASKHGKKVADAVAQHSNDAHAHDSGKGSKAGFHKTFAQKHLGGNNSAEHKAYKSNMDNPNADHHVNPKSSH